MQGAGRTKGRKAGDEVGAEGVRYRAALTIVRNFYSKSSRKPLLGNKQMGVT